MSVEIIEPDDETLKRFARFSELNPLSSIKKVLFDGEFEDDFRIENPWGDPSLNLFIYGGHIDKAEKFLNSVRLPRLLSAIHHAGSDLLEIVWTSRRLAPSKTEVVGRKFTFDFRGKKYNCSFDEATEELMYIADCSSFRQSSETNFRNLQSFKEIQNLEESPKRNDFDTPRCFFIEKFDLNEEQTVEFMQHLNFYMRYYDSATPTVILHLQSNEFSMFNRYVHGQFPKAISARDLDPNLLSFWGATKQVNPMMDYIICYRIIEYASVHFLDHDVRNRLMRIIASPHFGNNINSDVDDIAFVANAKIEDGARIRHLIKRNVDLELIWTEIESEKEYFCKDVEFDGGFAMKALIYKTDTKEIFLSNKAQHLADALRKVRNALSHGRDMETAGVVTPTLRNFDLLKPMVHIITIIAAQVILFRDVT